MTYKIGDKVFVPGVVEGVEAYPLKNVYVSVRLDSYDCELVVAFSNDLVSDDREPVIAPCPFCGGECTTYEYNTDDEHLDYVGCTKCNYESAERNTKQEAIAAHNRLIERLK